MMDNKKLGIAPNAEMAYKTNDEIMELFAKLTPSEKGNIIALAQGLLAARE